METLEKRREQFLSRYPQWEGLTLYQRFVKAVSCGGDRIFVIDDQKQYTYQEVLDRTEKAAAALKAAGVIPGTGVAVAMNNCLEFVVLTFALAKLGAIKVPINRSTGFEESAYILQQSEAKLFFTEREKDLERKASYQGVSSVIYMKQNAIDGVLSWDQFLEQGEAAVADEVFQDAHGIADVIYTSGSTGCSKGVMLSHDMLLRSAFASCINRGFEQGRRIYVPLPMFHVYGYVEGLLSVLFVEGSILITKGKFEVKKALAAMAQYRVNDILSVPSLMAKILQFPELDQYDLSSLSGVYCSASVCPKWVWGEIRRKLHVDEVITGYGMSEVSGASIQTDPLDEESILENRVGKILNGGCAGVGAYGGNIIEYRVIDGATGEDMPKGEYGELICRGPVVTRGYYHYPEANAKAFLSGGWMKTGDIGYFDDQGYLKFLGRCNDLYKINGENVSPQFLDKVISKCEQVSAVETVGVPDEKLGWIGVAFIEAYDPTMENKERIKEYCKANLAPYQVPKYFFFTSSCEWPHTSTGKIMKYKLREVAKAMLESEQAS